MAIHVRSLTRAMHGKRDTGGGDGLDSAVAELARTQFGLVTRRQLLELGASEDQIDRRLQRGLLHRLHRAVYTVGHSLLDRRGRFLGAVLSCGDSAALSHRSAAEMLEIGSPSSRAPEVSSPTIHRRRDSIVVHRALVPDDEIQVIAGIRTTGLSRTIVDLAARSSRSELERMLNEAEVRSLTDRISVPVLLERYPRRAGTAVLRQLLREAANARGITKKELERRFAALLYSTDLPQPRRNAHIAIEGQFFEVDCLWAEQRLIVELDGQAVHGTATAFERDRRKDRILMTGGWRVMRVTWRQLHGEPDAVIADLRRALRRLPPPPTL